MPGATCNVNERGSMIAISHAHAAKPQRKGDRASHPEDTVIDLGGGVKIGGGHFQVIAGPCSVEGDNLLTIAARPSEGTD